MGSNRPSTVSINGLIKVGRYITRGIKQLRV